MWLALLIASCMSPDKAFSTLIADISLALEHPFQITWNDYSPKALLVFLLLYCFAVTMYLSSIDILPIPTEDVVKKISRIILGIESDKTRFQNSQNKNNNFFANLPYELQQLSTAAHEIMDEGTLNNQRMLMVLLTLVHVSDSLEQFDRDTESYISIGRKPSSDFSILRMQQETGLNTVLPYGLREIEFMLSLCEQIIGSDRVAPTTKVPH